jgi:hypothetical protein
MPAPTMKASVKIAACATGSRCGREGAIPVETSCSEIGDALDLKFLLGLDRAKADQLVNASLVFSRALRQAENATMLFPTQQRDRTL